MVRRSFAVRLVFTVLVFLVIPIVFAHAQSSVLQTGPVSCFDHYTFGSAQVHIEPSVNATVSGVPITFAGTVINNNPYPIVEGALYVKVFRLRKNSSEKNVNGPYVVDQFFVKDGISIPAKGQVPVAFSWNVPSNAVDGEYEVATFFTTSKKFNLLGLSFTDDIVGNTSLFSVKGERQAGVEFDKSTVTVDENAYYFAASPPRVSQNDPVTVRAVVKNDTDEEVHTVLQWSAYAWDAQREESRLQHEETAVTIPAHGQSDVQFVAKDAKYAVYLVEGRLLWRDTKSIINVRFVREGINTLRLNFPSLESFPLRTGTEVSLFSCFHNEADTVLPGRIELTVTDESGNLIHEYDYTGEVPGNMSAVADHFTPTKNYDRLTLNAKLYNGEGVVDQVSIKYDCKDIDPASCLPESRGSFAEMLQKGGALYSALSALLLIMVVSVLGIWTFRHNKQTPLPVTPKKTKI